MGKKLKISFASTLTDKPQFLAYGLRATFFVRRMREMRFMQAWREVNKLTRLKHSFLWNERRAWGIDEASWERLRQFKVEPVQFFLHPRVLQEQPRLLLYYRCIAFLPQKGLQHLGCGSVAGIERGETDRLSADKSEHLIITINRTLCMILGSLDKMKHADLFAYLFASAGAQLQGSWNNAVGAEGINTVKKIIIQNLGEDLKQVVLKNDSSINATRANLHEILENIAAIKVLRLSGGYHCVFASEPDVSLRDSANIPCVAVEVKAGKDTAGALERLGAAMKSFQNERSLNARVKTVYVASALTREVRKRIGQQSPFDYTFDLADLMSDPVTQKRFVNLFVAAVAKRERGMYE